MTYWTIEDIARVVGLSPRTVRRQKLPEWERQNFPLPLPYNRRKRLYSPAAVQAWLARQEAATTRLPRLHLVK